MYPIPKNLCICTFFHLKGTWNFKIKETVRWYLSHHWKKNHPQIQSVWIFSLKYHDCPVDLATTKNGVDGSSIKIFDNCIFLQNETNRGDNKTVNRMNMYTDFGLVWACWDQWTGSSHHWYQSIIFCQRKINMYVWPRR